MVPDILDPPVIKKMKPNHEEEEECVVHPTIAPIGGGHRGKQLIFPKEEQKEQEHNTPSNQKDDTKDASIPKDDNDLKPSSHSDMTEQKLPDLTQSQDVPLLFIGSNSFDANHAMFPSQDVPIVPKGQRSDQQMESPLPLPSDACPQGIEPELDSIFRKEVKRQSSQNCTIHNFERLRTPPPPPQWLPRTITTTPSLYPSDQSLECSIENNNVVRLDGGPIENDDNVYDPWPEDAAARRQESLAISAIGDDDDAEDLFRVEMPSGDVNVPTGDLYPFQDDEGEVFFDSCLNGEFPV